MDKWWKNGVAFSCIQCAKCCSARDDVAYVYVNQGERQLMAKELQLPLATFTKRYARRADDGKYYLNFVDQHCIFLEDKKCTMHHIKPTQCRTWPFWEEAMASKAEYKKQVLDFCPGSNVDSPVVKADDIEKQINETEDAFFEV